MQPLKDSKHFFKVLLFEANSVVLQDQLANLIVRCRVLHTGERARKNLRLNPIHRRLAGRLELDGVTDEVLQEL